jgi:hypothetical protein
LTPVTYKYKEHEREKMFFKTNTVYKAYATERAAQAYKAKFFATNDKIRVEFCGGVWMVIA